MYILTKTILTTSDESWAATVSWERGRSQNVQSYSFPNIFFLDGWEGLKACTFAKRQSKGAHFEKKFRRAKRGEITSHFSASLRAVLHGLFTSNLLPTPMVQVFISPLVPAIVHSNY